MEPKRLDASDAYTVYVADDLIRRVRLFEFVPQATGTHVFTLYVDDGTAEFSDTCYLEVA